MKKLIRKMVLGTASVLALGIAGTALDYAAEPGNSAIAANMPQASQTTDSSPTADSLRKDDIRWAQVELRDRGLYKGSLDGVLGPGTKRALGQFQTKNGLDWTASLDAQTWEALTGDAHIGQGSSTPPNAGGDGSRMNSPAASDLGR
jgi:peptidoglycan hydrolase-like protein with peptidoglycan-binding domain